MDTDVVASPVAAEAWQLLMRTGALLRDRMFAACSELDLSPPQLHALRELSPDRPLPMRELAEKLRCDASNVTGIADRLEARGLVERQPDPEDRRVKALAVTPRGADVRDRILQLMLDVPSGVARLPETDQRALRDILLRVVDEE